MGVNSDLGRLARLFGVQLAHRDGLGRQRVVSEEGLVAVLRALGAEVSGEGDAGEALRARRRELAGRRLEPVVVAWGDRVPAAELVVPVGVAGRVECRLEREGGEVEEWSAKVEELPALASAEVEGERLVTRRLRLPALGLGRHRLAVRIGGERWEATVIATPRTASEPAEERRWGVFVPLYALHSGRSWGIGDCSDLAALGEWVADRGGSAVMTLPICAPVTRPFDPSPYAPSSRLFWNELYVDPRRQPELAESKAARSLIEAPGFAAEVAALRQGRQVDPVRQHALRRPVLAALAEAFFERGSEARRAEYEAFRAATPDLDDYAGFRAAAERREETWPLWPERQRGGRLGPGDFDPAAADLHRYAQWAMSEQLAAASAVFPGGGVGLALDLPLGVHPDGYDGWRHRDLFAAGVSAGAPPDALSEEGQDWGFAPLHPERQRDSGYAYLAAALRRMLAVAGLLRIDHVMQLHRLYWVPRGAGAGEGVYVRYPAAELYAVACLEARRAGARLVGENLGTVPRAVDASMRRHRMWGTWVLQHSIDAGSGLGHEPVPEDSVASLGTHDMPPFAAWWEGLDVERRREAGGLDDDDARAAAASRERQWRALARGLIDSGRLAPGESDPRRVGAAALESLGASRSPLVFANLEDLWGEREPQNVPGTASGNWLRRSALSIEEMAADAGAAEALGRLDAARRRPAEEEPAPGAAPSAPEPTGPAAGIAPPARGPLGPITPDDLHLFGEGRHFRLWEKLGAHPVDLGDGPGVYFAVWAPNAERVAVIGDFNGWDARRHPLHPLGGPGVWEGFVPGAHHGQRYKLRIESQLDGYRVDKADPFAFCTETPPATASVIWEPRHRWGDGEWMERRAGHAGRDRPVAVYEAHLGSWRRVPEDGDRPLSYPEAGPALAEHLRSLGFTHLELLPVMEHPFYGSWGYQTTSYFAPSRRFGDPDHLMELIDTLHRAGIGVVLDWVPSHFPADEHGLGWFDGAPLFEYSDPREGWHPDWKSLIFNYARGEVRSFLISSALFWIERFHADGLRVDAVASMLHRDYSRPAGDWVPNAEGGRENWEAVELLRQLNDEVHRVPGAVTFAEESTAWPGVTAPAAEGGLGFDYKWDLGWMNDTLTYLGREPVHRRWHHEELTFRGIYAFSECYALPLSHDEVVHGKGSLLAKMSGDDWQKRAQLRLLYAYQWTQPGKKLLFMGGEIGPWREWDHDSSLDWHLLAEPAHAGLSRWLADLNRLLRAEGALHRRDCDPAGFRWTVVDDADRSVIAYLRFGADCDRPVLAAFNFTPEPRYGYPMGVPAAGRWEEALNSDGEAYGGGGVGNLGAVEAVATGGGAAGGAGGETPDGDAAIGGGQGAWPARLELTLPPLGAVILLGPG